MDCGTAFTFMLLSFLLGNYLTYSSIDVTDLVPIKCRIAGVALLERSDRSKKFNYTMAESACEALGLQLANKVQVEKARRFGFETCSYGWVTDRYGVISRIQNNEKCGKNLTGVLTWTIPLSGSFNAYCFNASDTRINSCKPELMATTAAPTTSASTTMPPTPGSTLPPATLPPSTAADSETTVTLFPTTSAELSSRRAETTRVTSPKPTPKRTPPATTSGETTPQTTEELPNQPENHAARKNEKIVFGGLPTALLILALVFFVAAVGLAVCYVKKYKTNLIFRKIKEEKETVEAKVFRETGERVREEDITTYGKEEKLLQDVAITGKSIEAEV